MSIILIYLLSRENSKSLSMKHYFIVLFTANVVIIMIEYLKKKKALIY